MEDLVTAELGRVSEWVADRFRRSAQPTISRREEGTWWHPRDLRFARSCQPMAGRAGFRRVSPRLGIRTSYEDKLQVNSSSPLGRPRLDRRDDRQVAVAWQVAAHGTATLVACSVLWARWLKPGTMARRQELLNPPGFLGL